MIISVPTELDNDHMEVMKVAQDHNGQVTKADIKEATITWNDDRIQRALDLMLTQGMAWLDIPPDCDYDKENSSIYWFPRYVEFLFSYG